MKFKVMISKLALTSCIVFTLAGCAATGTTQENTAVEESTTAENIGGETAQAASKLDF